MYIVIQDAPYHRGNAGKRPPPTPLYPHSLFLRKVCLLVYIMKFLSDIPKTSEKFSLRATAEGFAQPRLFLHSSTARSSKLVASYRNTYTREPDTVGRTSGSKWVNLPQPNRLR